MTKENNQLLDSGSAQLLLGVMTLLYTVQRTVAAYDVVVDNVVNAQTTLLVGIAAQALESSNNAAQTAPDSPLTDAIRETLQEYSDIRPEFLASIKETYHRELEVLKSNFHFHTEKIKGMSKAAPTVQSSILLFPNLLLAPDAMAQLNEITEKLVRSTSPHSTQSGNAEKILNAVKAGGFTAMGYSLTNIFQLGKLIARTLGVEEENGELTPKIAMGMMIYDSYHTIAKLPSHLARVATGTMLAFTTGVLSSIVSENANLGLEADRLEKVTKETYSDYAKIAGSAVLSVAADWHTAYQFQMSKLTKLDQKLMRDEGVKKTIMEKPWKDPAELLMRKTIDNASMVKPALNGAKAAITATKATIFSTAFKLGKLAGNTMSWLVTRKKVQAAPVIPTIPTSKPRNATQISRG